MLLTSTSDIVRVVTTTVSVLNIQVSWADQTSTTFTPGRTNTIINSIGTNTILGSPGASTQRQAKLITIRNTEVSVENIVTVQHYDGSVSVDVFSVSLSAGYMLQYVWDAGWAVFDKFGNRLGSSGITAAGSDKQIQFNDGGTQVGADADITWNKTTNELALSGTDTSILLTGITTEPSPPSSNTLRLYSKAICGRMLPKWVGPSGVDNPFQPALFGNNICLWTLTTATAGLWMGTVGAGAGTYATVLPTATNIYTSMKRSTWANVITTANQVLGQRNTEAMFFRGSVTSQGGFFFFCRFGLSTYTAATRLFVGMHTATTVVSAEPSASLNILGFGFDSTDSVITFMHNDASGTAVKETISGQPTLVANVGYDAYIYCRPNDNTVYFRLDDLNAGTTIINSSVTTDLPVSTTMLTAGALASNAAVTPVNSITLGVNRIYVESDK